METRLVSLLGEEPVPLIEWFRKRGHEYKKQFGVHQMAGFSMDAMKVEEYLSQPFNEYMVIKPEEPKPPQAPKIVDERNKAQWLREMDKHDKEHTAWRRWQPVFLGEWESDNKDNFDTITVTYDGKTRECLIYEGMTRNDFISDWPYKDPMPKYNPEANLVTTAKIASSGGSYKKIAETFSICSECLCEVICSDDGCYCPDCEIIEGDTKDVTQEEWDKLLNT